MPKRQSKEHFGALPPQYHFALNPYPDMRFTSCPQCGAKTGQRKRALLIHIEPKNLIALNYTNRYCKQCDLLIAHKHEIEHLLTDMFRPKLPEVVGNHYQIFATVERKAWKAGMQQPQSMEQMIEHTSDFKSYEELRMTMAGYFLEDQEPPVMQPPASKEWVKR